MRLSGTIFLVENHDFFDRTRPCREFLPHFEQIPAVYSIICEAWRPLDVADHSRSYRPGEVVVMQERVVGNWRETGMVVVSVAAMYAVVII